MDEIERRRRWRLILGQDAAPQDGGGQNQILMDATDQSMDDLLATAYNTPAPKWNDKNQRQKKKNQLPDFSRWVSEVQEHFPPEVVAVMQKDAIERYGLMSFLEEEDVIENIKPNLEIASYLLSFKDILSDKGLEMARRIVKQVIDDLKRKLQAPMLQAIRGALNRSQRNYRPRSNEIDWHRTIQRNLKHYQPDHKTIIPERLVGYGYKRTQLQHVILMVDMSGSMMHSVIYSSIYAAVMAALPALKTDFILFDTEAYDVGDRIADPLELLFSLEMGGGTRIPYGLVAGYEKVTRPEETIMVLISDLFENYNEQLVVDALESFKRSGIQVIVLLALDDKGTPIYNRGLAARLAQIGIAAFGCNPEHFPDLMSAAINRHDIELWAAKSGVYTTTASH